MGGGKIYTNLKCKNQNAKLFELDLRNFPVTNRILKLSEPEAHPSRRQVQDDISISSELALNIFQG